MNLEAISESHSHSDISPEALLLSSLVYALAVSLSDSVYALTLASLIPLWLMLTKRFILSSLIRLNAFNLIMIITLALTWPDFTDGLMKGITIAFRVNMIYIFFGTLIYPMGYARIFSALNTLNIPEKLRVLLLLTLRGIFILHERFSCALTSLRLRAPELHGLMKLRTFAYVTASVLLQSSERSERMLRAIECRGGFAGFIQTEHDRLRVRDIILCICFIIYAIIFLWLDFYVTKI